MTSVATAFSVKWEGMFSRPHIFPRKTVIICCFNRDFFLFGLYCSYATSFVLERQTGTEFEKFYEAGRRGRSGEDCRAIYVECSDNN